MAYRGVGGVGNRPPQFDIDRPVTTSKRRIIYIEEDFGHLAEDEEYPLYRPLKRRRESFTLDVHFYTQDAIPPEPEGKCLPDFWSVPARPKLSPVGAVGMERTSSGHSISDDDPTEHRAASTELLEDAAAAQRVHQHMATFRRRNPDSKHERVLRNIISPKSGAAAYQLDNEALESIFLAANEIFFHGRLSQRVSWDWSHSSSPHYDSSVIGTTALRRASCKLRGFETLIVLSAPILRDNRRYSRRLLISTFLHELIHSYLFICCGFRARHCGGHTPGFHAIARMVDDWAGRDSFLYLSKMEADLSCFRAEQVEDDDVARDIQSHDDRPPIKCEQSPVHSCKKGLLYTFSGVDKDDLEDRHSHPPHDSSSSQHLHRHKTNSERVAYFEEDYIKHDESDLHWPDDRVDRSAPHRRHHPHQVPYIKDEDSP